MTERRGRRGLLRDMLAPLFLVAVSMSSPAQSTDGLVLIPAGCFQMGDALDEGTSDERPVRTVDISAFAMDEVEVTKALWDEVARWASRSGYDIEPEDARGQEASHPVTFVSWFEAVKWANARSEREGLTPCYTASGSVYRTGRALPECHWDANGYRLPTEAEWEKAARGGAEARRYPWSDGDAIDAGRLNYSGHHGGTTPVGSFAPNGYGLYDMAGNVWEWCWDRYARGLPEGKDPRGPSAGSLRANRGGSWADVAGLCRIADRMGDGPETEGYSLGFRLVRSVP